jgi:competence protein ComEC
MPKLRLFPLLAWIAFSGLLLADQGDALLQVHFVDVGQGDAIWIQGPAGECTDKGLNVIIDGGPDAGKGNRLITYLETYKFAKGSLVDYAIVTHPHNDHYPGMTDILKNYQVKTLVDSGFDSGVMFQKFLTLAKAKVAGKPATTVVEMSEQPKFQFPDCTELHMSILYAYPGPPNMGSGNSQANNASTVVRLEYKDFSFLFVGDLEGKARDADASKLGFGEKALLDKVPANKLHATVLKVGHHGSETSSTLSLIRAVQPDVIVIQSGRKAFGGTFLPDKTVIDRYKKERPSVTIVRTDEQDEAEGLDTTTDADGDDIAIVTDGDSLRVRQAQVSGGKRRWVTVKKLPK